MKLLQKVSLAITILFCIDYSISTLLDFSFLLHYLEDLKTMHTLFAFIVGVSAFLNILLFKREE